MKSVESMVVTTSYGSVEINADFHLPKSKKNSLRLVVRETVEAKPIEELQKHLKKLTPTVGTPRGNLRGYMHAKSLTMRALGKLAWIPHSHISEMISGKRPIGPKIARKLAAALGVDYRRFL